jgi:hypothetical protein
MEWYGLAGDRDKWRALVKVVMNLWVPFNARKFLSGLTTDGLLNNAQLQRVSTAAVLIVLFATIHK